MRISWTSGTADESTVIYGVNSGEYLWKHIGNYGNAHWITKNNKELRLHMELIVYVGILLEVMILTQILLIQDG